MKLSMASLCILKPMCILRAFRTRSMLPGSALTIAVVICSASPLWCETPFRFPKAEVDPVLVSLLTSVFLGSSLLTCRGTFTTDGTFIPLDVVCEWFESPRTLVWLLTLTIMARTLLWVWVWWLLISDTRRLDYSEVLSLGWVGTLDSGMIGLVTVRNLVAVRGLSTRGIRLTRRMWL